MDVAKLGFSVDTKPVDDATVSLNKLVPAAKSAETASKGFVAAINGVKGTTGAIGQAAAGMTGLSTASLRAGSAMGTVQSAAVGATGAIKVLGLAGARQGPPTALWDAYRASLLKVPAAANGAKTALDRLGASANDNINRLQSTPGNIAAQFQDIGVTAAGGMNPLLIALQQGTQLSAAMQGGIGNLLAGLKQLFNITTIGTIAIVALIAYVIQLGMEMLMSSDSANSLSDELKNVDFATYALGNAQSILGGVMDITTGKINTQSGALMGLARAQLLVAKVKAQTAQREALSEMQSAQQFKTSISGGMGGGFNLQRRKGMEGFVVDDVLSGKLNADQAVQQLERFRKAGEITDITFAKTAASIANFKLESENIKVFDDAGRLLDGDRSGTSYLLDPKKPPKPRKERGKSDAEQYADIVKVAGERIRQVETEIAAMGMATGAAALYRNEQKLIQDAQNKGIKLTEGQIEQLKNLAAELTASEMTLAYTQIKKGSDDYIKSQNEATAAIGLGAREAAMLKHQTDLTNQAIQQGIPINQARAASIIAWATAMTDADMKLAEMQKTQKVFDDIIATNKSFKEQHDQIGMTADQMSRYKYETIWLNDALDGVTDPAVIASFKQTATVFAENEIAIREMNEELDRTQNAMDFVRDGVKGFVSDLKGGLEQGKNFFSAFGDAVLNILNKIIDKLVDVALDAALGGGGPGTSGFLAAIGKIGASLFGGTPTPNAKGGVYGPSGSVTAFAKGGAFTNSIVSSPTLFKFAKGTGMMGEAGPEAIMPLKRGANGSLGVEVVGNNGGRGGGSGGAPTISITNTYTISGSSTADMQATVRQSAEQTKDQLRREIPQVLSEYQRNGAIA